ncbi:MAG: hypothetical protein ACXAC6_07875 [Candidatus Hodarchaeales archaeon]|jgi:hypothetical protein
MVEEAQNIKISARAWELLRWAKFELKEKSYSNVVVRLNNSLDNRQRKLENELKNFDEDRHRIKSKIPENASNPVFLKPKTILLSPEARRILNRLKLESRESAYTFSDGLEFLIRQNESLWAEIPKRLK